MTDLTTLTAIELKTKLDGHHRIGCSIEKNAAKRELYLHHVSEWCRVKDALNALKARS
jgi:hypothetical protein